MQNAGSEKQLIFEITDCDPQGFKLLYSKFEVGFGDGPGNVQRTRSCAVGGCVRIDQRKIQIDVAGQLARTAILRRGIIILRVTRGDHLPQFR